MISRDINQEALALEKIQIINMLQNIKELSKTSIWYSIDLAKQLACICTLALISDNIIYQLYDLIISTINSSSILRIIININADLIQNNEFEGKDFLLANKDAHIEGAIMVILAANDCVETTRLIIQQRHHENADIHPRSDLFMTICAYGSIKMFNEFVKNSLNAEIATAVLIFMFNNAMNLHVLLFKHVTTDNKFELPLIPFLTKNRLLDLSSNYNLILTHLIQAGANPHLRNKDAKVVSQAKNHLVSIYDFCREMTTQPHLEYLYFDELIELQTYLEIDALFKIILTSPTPTLTPLLDPHSYFSLLPIDLIPLIMLHLTPEDIVLNLIPALLPPTPLRNDSEAWRVWRASKQKYNNLKQHLKLRIFDELTSEKLVKRHFDKISLLITPPESRLRLTDYAVESRRKYRLIFAGLTRNMKIYPHDEINYKLNKLVHQIQLHDTDEIIKGFKSGYYAYSDLVEHMNHVIIDIHICHRDGSIMEIAANSNNKRLLDYLFNDIISSNITVSTHAINGDTLLHYAALCDQTDKITELALSDNIDQLNIKQQTALMYAVLFNRSRMLVLLLSAGANPNILDSNMKSPLYYAMKDNKLSIVHQLINAGGDVLTIYQNGKALFDFTPKDSILDKYLIWASYNSDKKCYFYLVNLLRDLIRNNYSQNSFPARLTNEQERIKAIFNKPEYIVITPEVCLLFINEILMACEPMKESFTPYQQEIIEFARDMLSDLNYIESVDLEARPEEDTADKRQKCRSI